MLCPWFCPGLDCHSERSDPVIILEQIGEISPGCKLEGWGAYARKRIGGDLVAVVRGGACVADKAGGAGVGALEEVLVGSSGGEAVFGHRKAAR